MPNSSLPKQQQRANSAEKCSSTPPAATPASRCILVTAPETPVTKSLCGANICVQAGRRGAKQLLGSIISARTFDLTEIGQAPGLEREYAEEHEDIPGGVDDCPDDISDDTSLESADSDSIDGGSSGSGSGAARVVTSAAETAILVDIDDNEEDDLTTITAGTVLEDLNISPASSGIGIRLQLQLPSATKEAELSVQIEKAIHRSMLKSIRDTAVLGTNSKKQTMLSASRAANSLFSFDSDNCDEAYLQELLNFDF